MALFMNSGGKFLLKPLNNFQKFSHLFQRKIVQMKNITHGIDKLKIVFSALDDFSNDKLLNNFAVTDICRLLINNE